MLPSKSSAGIFNFGLLTYLDQALEVFLKNNNNHDPMYKLHKFWNKLCKLEYA